MAGTAPTVETEPAAKSAWAFAAGDEIAPGRTAHRLLGGGERYEAYVAWNERLMTPTVIKILRPSWADDLRARRSLANEGALLGRLQHPGLIRLFDIDSTGRSPFLEIEYVDGPRLSTLLRRYGRLTPEQAFPLARQLAATLHYLHAERVLHLDIKPRNVIMGPIPRLIDLSVARTFDRVSTISGNVGTDAYMSPEQCDPELFGRIGPASDVWGLGTTVYEAIAKRRPFPRGRHDATGVERFPQLEAAPRPLAGDRHSQVLADLVMSCLRYEPRERPSVADLFESFDELAGRAGVGRLRLGK
ncbi:MAG: serine/threonine-protein kinase [Candidatus Limnocylindria bacterium]